MAYRQARPAARRFRLECLSGAYAICRAPAGAATDWAAGDLVVMARSRSEALSTTVICDETCVPPTVEHDRGWRAIRFSGAFDFSEVGVLAGVLGTLAGAQVPVMTISTFETDYLLIKAHRFERVRQVLEEAGHEFIEAEAT